MKIGAGPDSPAWPVLPRRRLNLFQREVWERAGTHVICGALPVMGSLLTLWVALTNHAIAYDFDRAFWPAGRAVLNGLSPYASTNSYVATHGTAFVYPAPGALLFAAFAWIPRGVADVVFLLLCAAAAPATLRVLGVRDWRVYGIAMLWPPVMSAWQTANVSLLLAFGLAVVWRHRDRAAVAGIVIGLLISLKIFLWPLIGWLVFTRRWRALVWAVASAAAISIAAWAVVGFDHFGAYTALASAMSKLEQYTAYTPLAVVLHLGAGQTLADIGAVACAALATVAALVFARKERDLALMLGAVAVSLLATPVVWRHYFVLFLVPLALARPRLSVLWFLPVLMWTFPVTDPTLLQTLVALAINLVIAISIWLGPKQTAPASHPVRAPQASFTSAEPAPLALLGVE